MDENKFTIELSEDDIDRIAELTDIYVETQEEMEEAIHMLLYELS